MFSKKLSSLFSGSGKAPKASLPDGQRIYAIGDIHGRCDLFEALMREIEKDDAAAGSAETLVILLGDLVDRGPDSAGVVRLARKWSKQRRVRVLMGNHEEMFVKSFEDKETLRHFLRHGGKDTILSYGVDRKTFNTATIKEAQQIMRDAVSKKDLAFIDTFEESIRIGSYLFVHAGIDPRRAIGEQRKKDMRWIREPFLSHKDPFEDGLIVVHGHTIRDEPEERKNRIGIDTGAYASGRLTSLVLQGTDRRFICAVQREDGAIGMEYVPPGSSPLAQVAFASS